MLEPVCAPLKDICGIIEGNVPVQFIEYIGPGGHDVWSPLLNICTYKGGVGRCCGMRQEGDRPPLGGPIRAGRSLVSMGLLVFG